ncbi:glycosyltransferase [Rhodoplanes sp. TEM]|uniref:Glycosyltransferase n=1 Tax=Rhodoplanes tepidamans TaxID=200616 RepID=A0ABT5JBR3_RHOTP|nr:MULTISPECIES: glycosyltransferase [Rhodoplanes]MDC7787138.1 glycosyltransferase [Rhodoplanes tepidamans]MDC7984298.1 glycosyltransferase [Rhodoplanes sp. TEM]MDQ0356095.1 glycosyltransferase involved in cell wall biosynthesis [Rhodoplanes tepidamans]
MASPRVMFVNHTSAIAGAELVLLDVVRAWRGATAFLFEDGPLEGAMRGKGLDIVKSRFGGGLAVVKRDASLWRAAPLAGRLAGVTLEIAGAARRHDVIYANSQKAFVLAALAHAVARRPLVWHLHDIIDGSHFGAGQRRLQVALANRFAARVIVPSEAAATAFVSAGGRDGLVEVVPNGVDIVRDPRSRDDLRRDLGLPAGRLVGVFSRLAPWKGQHVVIEALRALPDTRLLIVGDALFGEQAYAATLRRQVETLGLADRVLFLGHRPDVPLLMQAVDAMVHPSVSPEPFGRTLVEAMLSRVPVIATEAGAAPDILDHGGAGTLVPPADAMALAAALARVLDTPGVPADQIDRAEARARRRYGVAAMQDAVAAVIARVAGDHPAAGARA